MSEKKKTTKSKTTTTKEKKKTTNVKEEKKSKVVEVKEKKTVKPKKTNEKNKGILNEKEKKYYKVLSKIIRVVFKIGRICLMICVPFIFLAMVLIPFAFKNFEINGNIVKFGDVGIVIRDNDISVKLGTSVNVLECNTQQIDKLVTFLNENSKIIIILNIELLLLSFGAIIVLTIYLFSYLEKLFDNFAYKESPFTMENTNYIFKIAIFLSIIKVVDLLLLAFEPVSQYSHSYGIIEILIVFVTYFIFKYATGVQNKVNTKIYD